MGERAPDDDGGMLELAAARVAAPPSHHHHHNAISFATAATTVDADGHHSSAAALHPPPPPPPSHHRAAAAASTLSSSSSRPPPPPPPPPKLLPAFSRPPDLNLPPGVCVVEECLSLFCTVSAVALTLLATSLPLEVTTREEEEHIREAIWYYGLCATTVLLFFFKMQSSLEHAVILLAIDQLMLGLWLLGLVLLPVFLGRVIRWRSGTVARFGTGLLLADYLLLAVANLGFDASLCWHPHHRAMVYPRGQAARAHRLRTAGVGFVALLGLGLLEIFVENFTIEYILLVPLLLIGEQCWDLWAARRQRHHHEGKEHGHAHVHVHDGFGGGENHHPAVLRAAESVDLSDSSSDSDGSGSDFSVVVGVGEGEGKAYMGDVEAGRKAAPTFNSSNNNGPHDLLPPMGGMRHSSTITAAPAPPALTNPMQSAFSAIARGIRRHRAPRPAEQPPPARVSLRHVALPWWYRLRVKRIGEAKDLFSNVTGTALTLLGTMLPLLKDDEANHFRRFKTCLFMYFWAAMAVLLYYTRMRQLLSFRRFLFLPEVVLLCIWMILIVLIPQFMEAVALYGGGHGAIGKWTPGQANNTRLLVIHALLDICTTLFAASLLYWKRKVGRSLAREKAMGPSGANASRGGSGFSLTKIVIAEAAKVALTLIVLGCQLSINGFSNQYVYIIPTGMLLCEGYVHFFAKSDGRTD